MIQFLRIVGGVLIVVGALVILTWLIKPLREAWPHLIDAFRSFPVAVQIGLIVAAIGFLLLFSSIIWERLEDRKREGSSLLDEDN